MTSALHRFQIALVLALALSVPRVAGAVTDQERSAARDLAEKGDRAYRAGQFAEAQELFSRAAALVPAPTVLLFLARSSAQIGRLVQAREAYRRAMHQELPPDAPHAFRAAQESAKRELDAVERRIPRVTVSVRAADGSRYRVLIDGVETSPVLIDVAQPIDPGLHRFEVSGDGLESATVNRTIAESSHVTIVLEVQPGDAEEGGAPVHASPAQREAKRSRTAAYVSFGVGAVGLGFGAVMGARYFSKKNDSTELFDACNPTFCDPGQQQEIAALDSAAGTAGTLSIVGLAVGAVGVGTGLYFLLHSPRSEAPSVGFRLVPGGGSVVGSF